MSKTVDVDLRIRAKNLAGKTLDELNASVERLTNAQKKQATNAGLAARSMTELRAEAAELRDTYRELSRRDDMAKTFLKQREDISATAKSLQDLTSRYREMSKGVGASTSVADLQALGKEIIETNNALNKLVATNQKTATTLRAMGVDADNADTAARSLSTAAVRAGEAYQQSIGSIERHSAAVKENVAIQREAARRNAESAAQLARLTRPDAGVVARTNELSSLRADIEARSAAARAAEVEAEAKRRNAAAIAAEDAARRQSMAAIQAVARANAERAARQRDLEAAFGGEYAALERSNGIRSRLVGLLNTERGQRILAAEAARREAGGVSTSTNAHNANEVAVRRNTGALSLFDDTGRKSLGTYQRLRGQVLALSASFIGLYTVLEQGRRAFQAQMRNQSLQLGLETINKGDVKAAAEDY
ncbi:MAG TPA: hypothetical protein VGB05_11520, partial [Pyrinomonadaceae bacterium]